jgi:predicted heme/steroid binding protein/uncharacterized membrane protein
MNRYFIVMILIFFVLPFQVYATSEYSEQTGYECGKCHIDPAGGGALTDAGLKFLDDAKIKRTYRPLTNIQRVVRFIIGYLHLLTAIIWFGTILYVHLLLKPAYAAKGLPKGELFLGWISIIIMLITGTLLTISRIPSWHMFYTTRFGILLSIKIVLFMIMALTALIVTVFIGPKLRRQRTSGQKKISGEVCVDELCHFDGKEGRPAYIAYKGMIYDVTGSKMWKGGFHLKKHSAGNDLTNVLKSAPHGEEKVLSMPIIGKLHAVSGKPQRPFHEKVFYFMAYMNLFLVFLIIFVIALMRWG